jgi:hypothetical protein
MKKLIEFQEEKHSQVIEVISKFRDENKCTFSEAIRKLILLSQNGNCAPDEDRIETVEKKLEHVIKVSKIFKKYMEEHDE